MRGEGPSIVRSARERALNPAKDKKPPGAEIVKRKHPDWVRWEIVWRRLLDALESGQRYRDAEYGADREGRPLRALARHKREYPDPLRYPNYQQGIGNNAGSAVGAANPYMMGPFPGMLGADQYATMHDDDFEYRRARTPVPDFLAEVIDTHLSKIYDQAIGRQGPPELVRWWSDVSGSGTPIDDWMRDDVAPLLMTLGCLDVVFDRPIVPPWVKVNTRYDEISLGLDACVASIILPVNMIDWNNDPAGHYEECLVREYWSPSLRDPDKEGDPPLRDNAQGWAAEFPGESRPQEVRFRHWTGTTVTLYDAEGEIIEDEREHGYPCVPIIRLIDRKRHRTPMIGKPRFEAIAELQREYYNRDSESMLNDTLQSSPLLSGPQEFCKPEQSIQIGAGFVLPKWKDTNGNHEGWEFVSPPRDPADSLRENKRLIREEVDRAGGLTRPAGVTGTTGGTVSQSGFSKMFDAEAGSRKLGSESKSLSKAERQIAEFGLMCIRREAITPEDRAQIKITYPSRFQLKNAEAILGELNQLTNILAVETQITEGLPGGPTGGSGTGDSTPADQKEGNPKKNAASKVALARRFLCPTIWAEKVKQLVRADFSGASPELLSQIDAELEAFFALHALPEIGTTSRTEAMQGHGSEEQMAGEDRTGSSAATAVNPTIPQAF